MPINLDGVWIEAIKYIGLSIVVMTGLLMAACACGGLCVGCKKPVQRKPAPGRRTAGQAEDAVSLRRAA